MQRERVAVAPSTPSEAPSPEPAGRPPWVLALALVALLAGAAARTWILREHVSPTESDEAVLALIGLHFARGDVHLMYWGQPYGGPLESLVAAPLLLLFGPSVLVTKLVGTAFCLASAVLVWRIGRRTVGDTAGLLGGALLWVWPPYFVFYSTKMSIYFGSLFLAVVVALQLVRLATGDPGRWWAPVTGVAAGLAFWASPQTLFLALPLGVALLPRLVGRWRTLVTAVPFGLLGAAPWLVHNATTGWTSFRPVPTYHDASYLERVVGVPRQVPLALGLRAVGSERWLYPPLAVAVLAAFVVGIAVVLLIRRPRWSFLGWALVLFPFAYATSPMSVYSPGGNPRYFLMAMPLVALLGGAGVAWLLQRLGPPAAVTALVIALLFTTTALRDFARRHEGWFPGAPDQLVPPTFGDLRRLLRDHEVAHAYADYWISFRATFETGEATIVAPVQPWLDRYPPYSAEVAASPAPAYVTLTRSAVTFRLQELLTELGIPFETWTEGEFVLVQPAVPVPRETVVAAYQLKP